MIFFGKKLAVEGVFFNTYEGVFFNTTDYDLQKEKLGEGAFGTVYVAKNLIDEQLYAAKLIHCSEGIVDAKQIRPSINC